MKFDIEEFKKRLDLEKARGTEPADYITQEVHQAEHMKIGLVEEMEHAADFVIQASNEIDRYLFYLHELAAKYPLTKFQLDQRTAIQDRKIQDRIRQQLQILDKEADPERNDQISPLDLS